MSGGLIYVLIWVLSPLAIATACLLTRSDNRRTIPMLSIAALVLGGFDFIVSFFEVMRVIPYIMPTPNYSFIDTFRFIFHGIGVYAGIAATVFALFRTAQSGKLGWMTAILIVVMVSLVSAGISGDPYLYFSRPRYTSIDALLFAVGGYLASFVTLIYALATRRDTAPTIPVPMPMMYPPMMYPPMMYPPLPTPYGPPVAYAPPPPVVLPVPQPQPPTMTTPS